MKVRISLVIALAALAGAALAQDAVKIQWKPAVGQSAKYHLEVLPEISGMEMQISMDMATKIVKVDTDGKVTSESRTTGMKMVMNGQEQPMPGEAETVETDVALPNGERFSHKSSSPMDNPKLTQAITFTYPDKDLKIGDTWTRDHKADATTPASITTYKYVGDEKIGKWSTHKITYTFKETGSNPMTSTSTIWIDATTGEMVKGDYRMENMEFQPGMNGNATSHLTRIS